MTINERTTVFGVPVWNTKLPTGVERTFTTLEPVKLRVDGLVFTAGQGLIDHKVIVHSPDLVTYRTKPTFTPNDEFAAEEMPDLGIAVNGVTRTIPLKCTEVNQIPPMPTRIPGVKKVFRYTPSK